MKTQGYFITGTDTGVGKTSVTIALMQFWKRQGKTVVGMKPVASGCVWENGRLVNHDALLIQQYSSVAMAYKWINPYAYELAISPHLAGVDNPVRLEVVRACFERLKNCSDVIVVEGAGGWYSPLAEYLDNAQLAIELGLPVILVVAVRLGCINQARLSVQAIERAGVECLGWIGVCIDPNMQAVQENLHYLESVLTVPLLSVMPFAVSVDFDVFAETISIR